ncbi:MAG: IMPACT family protein [Muribaculaceae bacterium]|nr:IMPACT family protein [Muribaculaceae bacterium]MDE7080404.1 IMPACT family protein [Muribaculaceae bacterium]
MDTYYHIARAGEGQYREKMSRFLAFAMPVADAADARDRIKEYQNAYHDARHVCWAYMLGPDMADWQLNDNGEPSGTAGKPILGQIRSHGVTDVLVVVVRYFGGIKLGTSGLITAYREAACLALDEAGRKEMHRMTEVRVEVPYISLDGVMRIIKESDTEIVEQSFDMVCALRLLMRADHSAELLGKMGKTEGVTITLGAG